MGAVMLSTTMSEGHRLASVLGYAGFFFLAAAVLLGMATALDGAGTRFSGAVVEQLHLSAAIAGIAGVAGHILAHTVREVGGLTFLETVVPFAAGGWIVAAGVTGWLGLVLVVATVPWRRRLGYRSWLIIHRSSYGASALIALHVIAASDEVGRAALVGIAVIASVIAVIVAGVYRRRGTSELRSSPDVHAVVSPAAGPASATTPATGTAR